MGDERAAGAARGGADARSRRGSAIRAASSIIWRVSRRRRATRASGARSSPRRARRGERGVAETFLWALPQVAARRADPVRGGAGDVTPFDDVDFPIAIGAEASVAPGFSTNVVTSASGHEYRNANWSEARLRFDAGPGVRGDAELDDADRFLPRAARARRSGSASAIRSTIARTAMTGVPRPTDQPIGDRRRGADAVRAGQDLWRRRARRITRPVAGTVRVAVDGVEQVERLDAEPPGAVAVRRRRRRAERRSARASCSTCRCALPRTGWRSTAQFPRRRGAERAADRSARGLSDDASARAS